ncbi:MAG: DNA polymerase I, partial [Rhodoferax sp.]|nr:DNA polymerase I [Rhodoferax sp.]
MAPPDEAALMAFYEQYGFKGLVRSRAPVAALQDTLTAPSSEQITAQLAAKSANLDMDDLFAEPTPLSAVQGDSSYETILTWEQLDVWLQRVQAAPCAAIDTETTSLDAMRAELVGISLSVKAGEAAYL